MVQIMPRKVLPTIKTSLPVVCRMAMILMLTVSSALFAEETQRTETVYYRFPPALVNDEDTLVQTIQGLPENAQFEVVQGTGVFALLTPSAQLRVVNRQLTLTVAFRPLAKGLFQSDILLRQLPLPSKDTLRLRCSGTGYQIQRDEIRDFGDVIVGDEDTIVVLARAGLASNEKWQIQPSTLPQPFALDPPNGPIRRNDTLAFRFLFAPQRTGSFEQRVLLQRMNNSVDVETIQVTLRGNGIRFPIFDTLRFGKVLTADTLFKSKIFRKPGIKPEYEVVHKPKLPFDVHLNANDKPTPRPPDSAMVAASFKPVQPGVYVDSLVIYRKPFFGAAVIDTISIIFTGEAVSQPDRKEVSFTNVSVGDSLSQLTSIQIPLQTGAVQFAYDLVQSDAGPARGKVATVNANEVSLRFDCVPTSYAASQTQRFILNRRSDGKAVDSTIVAVTTTMIRKPIRLTVTVDTAQGKIGDTLAITVRYKADDRITEPVTISRMTLRLGYNPTLWVPLPDATIHTVIENDSVFVVQESGDVPLATNSTSGVLSTIRGLVTMGDADQCPLPLSIVALESNDFAVSAAAEPGYLVVSNVWQYGNGSKRFVNPIQGLLTLVANPNPIQSSSTLTATNVPGDTGRLTIVDALGQIHADLTADLQSGKRSWTVSKTSGSDVTLLSGSYYARLIVYGINGDQIYSVTRLLIVE